MTSDPSKSINCYSPSFVIPIYVEACIARLGLCENFCNITYIYEKKIDLQMGNLVLTQIESSKKGLIN